MPVAMLIIVKKIKELKTKKKLVWIFRQQVDIEITTYSHQTFPKIQYSKASMRSVKEESREASGRR